MHIYADDIAGLDDLTVKRLAMAAEANASDGPQSPFWHAMSEALVKARAERVRAAAELDILADDGIGALLGDDDLGDCGGSR